MKLRKSTGGSTLRTAVYGHTDSRLRNGIAATASPAGRPTVGISEPFQQTLGITKPAETMIGIAPLRETVEGISNSQQSQATEGIPPERQSDAAGIDNVL